MGTINLDSVSVAAISFFNKSTYAVICVYPIYFILSEDDSNSELRQSPIWQHIRTHLTLQTRHNEITVTTQKMKMPKILGAVQDLTSSLSLSALMTCRRIAKVTQKICEQMGFWLSLLITLVVPCDLFGQFECVVCRVMEAV